MRDFRHKGKHITLHSVAGQVLAADRSTSTAYALSGGGGFVPSQGGYVTPPQLIANASVSSDFWLRLDDGADRHFVLDNESIPMLAGQRVAMVLGTTEGAVADVPVGLLNISSRMWYGLAGSGGLLRFVDAPSKTISIYVTWLIIVVVAVLAFVGAVALNRADWSVLVIAATVVFGYVYAKGTQIAFASRVSRARERMLTQANEDCRHYFDAAKA